MIAPQMICAQCMDVPHIQLLRLVSSNPRDQCQLHLATEIGHRAYAATRIASRWAWAQLPPHHPRTHDADAAYTRRDHRLRYEDLRCRIERKSSHNGVGQSTRCMFYHISNKSTHLPAKPTCCQCARQPKPRAVPRHPRQSVGCLAAVGRAGDTQ